MRPRPLCSSVARSASSRAATTAGASDAISTPQVANSIDLHNNTAEAGTDCPEGGGGVLDFVFAPNNGSASFTSITLNLGSETLTFSGAAIVPNGTQTDNVFVAVPCRPCPHRPAGGGLLCHLLRRGADPLQPEPHLRGNGADHRAAVTEPPVTEPPITEPPVTEPPRRSRRSRRPPVDGAAGHGAAGHGAAVTEPPVTEPAPCRSMT